MQTKYKKNELFLLLASSRDSSIENTWLKKFAEAMHRGTY